jgi:histidinol-phosphatase (PHP family)
MYDYHTHTTFSEDAENTMDEMVEAAIAKGLDEIALTDHFDPEYPDPLFKSELDPERYEPALTSVSEKYAGRVRVVRGIELGLQPGAPNARNAQVVSGYDYDFVIASIHSVGEYTVDMREYAKKHGGGRKAMARAYYGKLIECLDDYGDFDVFGHLNVIDRYTDELPREEEYFDLAEEALRKIVQMGKGIEINTSSFRYGMGAHTTPTLNMLKRYVALGGEIVTTGSDAHRAADVGAGLPEGMNLLRAAGLTRLTTFRNRIPTFVDIRI